MLLDYCLSRGGVSSDVVKMLIISSYDGGVQLLLSCSDSGAEL
jgi:hypothetical protein